jgi:hypothetical protein
MVHQFDGYRTKNVQINGERPNVLRFLHTSCKIQGYLRGLTIFCLFCKSIGNEKSDGLLLISAAKEKSKMRVDGAIRKAEF